MHGLKVFAIVFLVGQLVTLASGQHKRDKEEFDYNIELPLSEFSLVKSALSEEFMRRVNKELVKLSGQLLATSVLVSGNYYPKTVTVSRYLSATAHSQRLDEFKKHFSAGIRLVVKMCDEVRHFVERLLGVARILLKEWVFEDDRDDSG